MVVDHGSRAAASNALLEDFVAVFAAESELGDFVLAAHMELAEPSIADAFKDAVERGATTVVVAPYFLSPGRHWQRDIPSLVAEAAAPYPHVRAVVSAPIGVHKLVAQVLDERARRCLDVLDGKKEPCEICAGRTVGCTAAAGAAADADAPLA